MVVDVLETVFKNTGLQQAVNAQTTMANATDRLATAQDRLTKAHAGGNTFAIDAAQRRLNIAQRNITRDTFQEAATATEPFLRVLKEIDSAAMHAIDTFRSFGREVLTVQSLTGASRGETSGTLALLNAAGIHDRQAVKTLMNVSNSAFSGESGGALAMLGIYPMQGQSGIDVLNQVIDRLSQVQDGLLKAHVETQIFGEGGAESLQPLLRMSRETREQIERFSQGMGDGAQTAQKLDEASAKLSAGWEALTVRVGRPLPMALAEIEDGMVGLLDLFDRFDRATNGLGTTAVIFVGIAASIIAGALAMTQLIRAFAALNAVLKVTITMQAVLDTLQGNAAALGLAAAVAVGGYVVSQNLGTGAEAGNGFGRHVGRFGDAVNRFASNLDQYRGSSFPARSQTPTSPASVARWHSTPSASVLCVSRSRKGRRRAKCPRGSI